MSQITTVGANVWRYASKLEDATRAISTLGPGFAPWHVNRSAEACERIDAVPQAVLKSPIGVPMARYSYRVHPIDHAYIARCVEMSVEAEGATVEDAVEHLRNAIQEKRSEPNAMAPPPPEWLGPIELVLAEAEEPTRSPQGPGEVAPRS